MIDLSTDKKYLLLPTSSTRTPDALGNVCLIETGLYQYNYTKDYMIYTDSYQVSHIIPKASQLPNSKVINNNYLINSVRSVLTSLKLTTDDQLVLLKYLVDHVTDATPDEDDLNDW